MSTALKPKDLFPVGGEVTRAGLLVTDRFALWDLMFIADNPRLVSALQQTSDTHFTRLGAGWTPKVTDVESAINPDLLQRIMNDPRLGEAVVWTGLTSTSTSKDSGAEGPSVLVLTDGAGGFHFLNSGYERLMADSSLRLTWHVDRPSRTSTRGPNKIIGVNAAGDRVAVIMLASHLTVTALPWLRDAPEV